MLSWLCSSVAHAAVKVITVVRCQWDLQWCTWRLMEFLGTDSSVRSEFNPLVHKCLFSVNFTVSLTWNSFGHEVELPRLCLHPYQQFLFTAFVGYSVGWFFITISQVVRHKQNKLNSQTHRKQKSLLLFPDLPHLEIFMYLTVFRLIYCFSSQSTL